MEAKLDKCLFKGTVKGVFRLFIAVQQTTLKLWLQATNHFICHIAIDQGGQAYGTHPRLQN